MFYILLVILAWGLCIWYLYDSYTEVNKLCADVATMFRVLKKGICEDRRCIGEIISDEPIFNDSGATDLSMFLWENHDKLGLGVDLIDRYNAFIKESEFSSAQSCSEGITELERTYRAALTENAAQVKKRFISVVTLCTAAFAIGILLLV